MYYEVLLLISTLTYLFIIERLNSCRKD